MRRAIGFGCLSSMLFLSGCAFMLGQGSGRLVTKEDLEKIRVGMLMAEAWTVLGRPWQVVVDGAGGTREVHRYKMEGEEYRQRVRTYDPDNDEYVTDTVMKIQLRIVELTFADGKLVKGNE